jgi:molybdopterin-guanine dinucleotide biosynthesis protein A
MKPYNNAMPEALLTGFVLAGGKSTRMGRDKATLTLAGRTLLDYALAVLRQVAPEVCILGSRRLYSGYGAPVIEDIYRDCGPLGGIHAALTHTRTDYNLIIAVDTPFLSPEFLSWMAQRAIGSGAVVATPEIAGYRQPLCSVYSRQFLPLAEKALRSQRAEADSEGTGSSGPVVKTSVDSGRNGEETLAAVRGRTNRDNAEKSTDFKLVPLFPDPGTLVISQTEMARFAFTTEMFENLNTPQDFERAREKLHNHE